MCIKGRALGGSYLFFIIGFGFRCPTDHLLTVDFGSGILIRLSPHGIRRFIPPPPHTNGLICFLYTSDAAHEKRGGGFGGGRGVKKKKKTI